MQRTTLAPVRLTEHRHGAALLTLDASLDTIGPDLDPFIAVSLYDMRGPTFPPHPHAGFMVATYILPESEVGFVNHDSLGTRNRIAPGALHVTIAGSGVIHEEQPETAGPLAKGFQIWIDLANADRERKPEALHLAAPQVPVITAPGVEVRLVLGRVGNSQSPLVLPTAVSLYDIRLQAHAQWTAPLVQDDHAFAFMLGGSLSAGHTLAEAGQLVRTRPDGTQLSLTAGAQGARLCLFAGTPLRQPRVAQGPFVAGSGPQLLRFAQNHAAGRFGRLQPFART